MFTIITNTPDTFKAIKSGSDISIYILYTAYCSRILMTVIIVFHYRKTPDSGWTGIETGIVFPQANISGEL